MHRFILLQSACFSLSVLSSPTVRSATTSNITSNHSSSISSCPESGDPPGTIPLTYECKRCDSSTVWTSIGANDPVSAWSAADANNALAETLRWYNLAKWGVVDTCPDTSGDPSLDPSGSQSVYASSPSCTNSPRDMLPNDENYLQGLQSLWNGPPDMTCGMTEGSCNAMKCEDGKYPADYLITNSIVNLRNLLKSQYDGLDQALDEIESSMSDFATTFAPVVEDDAQSIIPLLIDIATIGYGQLAAFSWNKILKDAKIFKDKSKDHGWAKDSTNSIVSTGATTAKDALSSVTAQIANENHLLYIATNWTRSMMDNMEIYLDDLQNGSLPSNDNLNTTLFNGMFSGNPDNNITMESMRDIALSVLYGQLLIPAWNMVADAAYLGPIHVAILEQPGYCNLSNPFDGQDPDDSENWTPCCRFERRDGDHAWAMSDSDAVLSRVCLGGSSTYYLIATGYGNPEQALAHALPGVDQLAPNNRFGGLTIATIVNSSVMGYQLNSNANGYKMPDNSMIINGQGDLGDFIFQESFNTPGYFTVPICGADEMVGAMLNIDPTKDNCNNQWPCCGSPETGYAKGSNGNPPRR